MNKAEFPPQEAQPDLTPESPPPTEAESAPTIAIEPIVAQWSALALSPSEFNQTLAFLAEKYGLAREITLPALARQIKSTLQRRRLYREQPGIYHKPSFKGVNLTLTDNGQAGPSRVYLLDLHSEVLKAVLPELKATVGGQEVAQLGFKVSLPLALTDYQPHSWTAEQVHQVLTDLGYLKPGQQYTRFETFYHALVSSQYPDQTSGEMLSLTIPTTEMQLRLDLHLPRNTQYPTLELAFLAESVGWLSLAAVRPLASATEIAAYQEKVDTFCSALLKIQTN